ncbi:hypothetical protein WS62_23810 [Burkholderia sp. ABCPW 14]|uniref:hypothetical protein n=1 Tax=Burkholderia sp. ABCPW 14 TaxID=1637860 RepID=UPI000770CDF8|nr:hypothetical protein [Burkholderia sp. ABCPW 14]KVD81982.1 hypothetical protein WS62_23810 [Burkholderia sp. ABCPW 14]
MKRKLDEEAGTLRNRIAKAGMKSKTPDERSNWLRARTREIGDWKRRLGGVDSTSQDVQALESKRRRAIGHATAVSTVPPPRGHAQCDARRVTCA